MKIKSLNLKNFRGFKALELDFPRDNNVAVFIGINGAGKSSVLDALAILLSRFVAKLTSTDPRSGTFPFTEEDFFFGSKFFNLQISLDTSEQYYPNFFFEVSPTDSNSRGILGDVEAIKHLQEQLLANPDFNLPVLAYYRTNRFISDQAKDYDARVKPFIKHPQFNTYKGSFFKRFTSFDAFVIWFTAEEDLENQIISRNDRNHVNPNLKVVRESIEIFFSKLTSSQFSKLRVNRSRQYNDLRYSRNINAILEVDKDSRPLKITSLSDGEKSLLIIVCDIARRLAIANPSLLNPREGKGIVLIDEVDAHLHPQWQREVVPALQVTFPNCQFITTTHSPQVLSNLKRESIFILENWKIVQNNPYSYGRDTNSILYEFMGVSKRPNWMQEQLEQCFQLIDKEKLDEAKRVIQELQNYLGQNDPDIVKASTMIHFLDADNEVY